MCLLQKNQKHEQETLGSVPRSECQILTFENGFVRDLRQQKGQKHDRETLEESAPSSECQILTFKKGLFGKGLTVTEGAGAKSLTEVIVRPGKAIAICVSGIDGGPN